ncbi:hypothetical protein [Gaoshiqia sp. Z1-71]|uniref:hypothetical protein n=1 Tax=Gaoshiqia hydrogeniformans TaxID=3290090 RepID=UPI003BF8FD6B
MKKLYIIALLFLFQTNPVKSQNVTRAVGIRGGITSGIEYRAFAHDYLSYRALLSTRYNGIQFTGLKEFHEPGLLEFSDEFVVIYGFGAHVGFERWRAYNPRVGPHDNRENRGSPVAGLDALAGVEYNFWDIPLTVGLEVKPYFSLFGRNFFHLQPFDFAVTIRYVF